MNYRLLLALLATAALAATTLHAQADDDEDDDQEFDYFAYFSRAHSNVTFGFRATQGAKVKFGNVGSIPVNNPVAPYSTDPTANNVARSYNNGFVGGDIQRPEETNGRAQPTTTPGRYILTVGQRDGTGSIIYQDPQYPGNNPNLQVFHTTANLVSYVPNYSRNYGINDSSQINATNGTVDMREYSISSDGAMLEGKKALSGGVEFQAARLFTDPAKRFRFSLVAGMSLNGINSKRSGTVGSTLHIVTDTYAFQGGAAGVPLDNAGNPVGSAGYPLSTSSLGAVSLTDENRQTYSSQYENTSPLNLHFDRHTEDDDEEVSGVWEVKGAYLVLRIGPEIGASITPNLSFNAGAGFAGAYVGTNYTAIESAVLTDPTLAGNTTISTGTLLSEENKFLAGYYANLDAAWAVNERTGFYAGLSYESFGDFSQTLAGRTARIDLGGNASLRGGINIKF